MVRVNQIDDVSASRAIAKGGRKYCNPVDAANRRPLDAATGGCDRHTARVLIRFEGLVRRRKREEAGSACVDWILGYSEAPSRLEQIHGYDGRTGGPGVGVHVVGDPRS